VSGKSERLKILKTLATTNDRLITAHANYLSLWTYVLRDALCFAVERATEVVLSECKMDECDRMVRGE
jgi:hypothetical protein